MLIEDLGYFKQSANYSDKYSGMDCLEKCWDKEWFKNYPIQDFDYKFNSWGFRGPEYNQYIGKPVNICLGDSFTVNVGGPIEHSWPSLLQEKFDNIMKLGYTGKEDGQFDYLISGFCFRTSVYFFLFWSALALVRVFFTGFFFYVILLIMDAVYLVKSI